MKRLIILLFSFVSMNSLGSTIDPGLLLIENVEPNYGKLLALRPEESDLLTEDEKNPFVLNRANDFCQYTHKAEAEEFMLGEIEEGEYVTEIVGTYTSKLYVSPVDIPFNTVYPRNFEWIKCKISL